jgi:hypothetical protein
VLKERFLLLLPAVWFLLFPLSCDWKGGAEITDNAHVLADMVFAGEDSNGNWTTLAFKENNSGVYFVAGGNEAEYNFDFSYSYDKNANIGNITKNNSAGNAAFFTSGDFTLKENGSRLVFSGTGPRLLQVRDSNGTDLAVLFDVKPLPPSGSLDGTVWAATGFRTKDWTSLSVASPSPSAPHTGTISVFHSFDASNFNRPYADYNPQTGEGTLAYLGAFKIKDDVFTFLNFYGHGAAVSFKRMR